MRSAVNTASRLLLAGLFVLLLLGALLIAGRTVSRADDWDGDRVISEDRSDSKDGDSAQPATDSERREAYDEANDPDSAAAAKLKARKDKSKSKAKSKGKNKQKSHEHAADDAAADSDIPPGVEQYGGYFGDGDASQGAPVDGSNVRYVEGKGYEVTSPDGTTSFGKDRDGEGHVSLAEEADRHASEQVWGPLWGVPADSPVMRDYDPGRDMPPEEEEALRSGQRVGEAEEAQSSEQDSADSTGDDAAAAKAAAREAKAEKARAKAEAKAEAKANKKSKKKSKADDADSGDDNKDSTSGDSHINRNDPEDW